MEMIHKNRLSAEDVREVSEGLLKKHLSLNVDGSVNHGMGEEA